jgi:hypothetical protein
MGSAGFFFGPGNRDTLNDDWTFEMRAMKGPVLLRTMRTPPGYTLKAVYFNNQDVTDSGINFKPGESISGVQVVLTAKSSTVSGSVTDARSQPATDYAAIIFAEDSAKWGFMSRFVHMARPDQQGAFQVKDLPPGRYLAAAVDYLEEERKRTRKRSSGCVTPRPRSRSRKGYEGAYVEGLNPLRPLTVLSATCWVPSAVLGAWYSVISTHVSATSLTWILRFGLIVTVSSFSACGL